MEKSQKASHANIRCRTIIEVLGKPQEHVEKTIREYVEKIKHDEDYVVLKEEFSQAKEQDEFWSIFVEMEFLVKGVNNLVSFCFDYMPSSMEILSPEELIMPTQTINQLLNDLQARLHQVDMVVKQQKNQSDHLRENLNKSIKNIITVGITHSPMDKETISKVTGVEESQVNLFLEQLMKEGVLKKDGDIYSRAKKA